MPSRPSGCAHGPGPPTASHFETGPRRLSPDLKALYSLWESGQRRLALYSMVGVNLGPWTELGSCRTRDSSSPDLQY